MARPQVLGVVLAGGEGRRLWPLTRDRAKPAVPFGASYRLVDFALSNLVNAGYSRVAVLTQYKSHSLDRHIGLTWRLSPLLGQYVIPVPAQMRAGKRWFEGSADAIFQNLNLLTDEQPDYVCVFSADHIYRMDPEQMVRAHAESGAGVTVAGLRIPKSDASRFGVMEPGSNGRIARFREKPAECEGLPGDPEHVMASMGIYVFSTRVLMEAVSADAARPESHHDMGGDIITALVESGEAAIYDYGDNRIPGTHEDDPVYWRDVGTLDTYYEAHMDLISVHPQFNLYNDRWPIHSWTPHFPPAKFVFDDEDRRGMAVDSIVSSGVIISGGQVRNSVLSPGVRVNSYATVEGSVIMEGCEIGRHATVRKAILDKNIVVPPGARIGVDEEEDRARGFVRSEGGIVVLGKGDPVPSDRGGT